MLPKKLQQKLLSRKKDGSLRALPQTSDLIDFSSNDYLGFAFAQNIKASILSLLSDYEIIAQGATGSRLLSGNHKLYEVAEGVVSRFHESDSALIFNSGYDANIGFFQCVPQRGDLIIYDEYIHASIRDGIQMSLARGYKFKHNDLEDLDAVISRLIQMHHVDEQPQEITMYVVTESVFSMDGDSPDLKKIAHICAAQGALLVVDEAHAVGVIGRRGEGLVQKLRLGDEVFARIVTFGKGIGAHGAAILGSSFLKEYLVNYARSFIYTTGLPPHTVAHIIAGYEALKNSKEGTPTFEAVGRLQRLITYFNARLELLNLSEVCVTSHSAIHCALISGNDRVKKVAHSLQGKGYDVRAILSPTVPIHKERLRICLHTFNTQEEVDGLLTCLSELLKQ